MNPVIVATVFSIVKGLIGRNTRDGFESKTGKARPAALARRSIGIGIMVLSSLAGAITGVAIPEAGAAVLTTSFSQAFDAIVNAWPAVTGAWGSVVLLIGYFKRKKV